MAAGKQLRQAISRREGCPFMEHRACLDCAYAINLEHFYRGLVWSICEVSN